VTVGIAAGPEAGPARAAPRLWQRFGRSRRSVAAGAFVAVVVLVAVGAPLVAFRDPMTGSADALLPPVAAGHLLGTDDLGRDVWARLVYGARVSVLVGVVAAACSLAIGTGVGAAAGFFGGWVDRILMRVSEFFQTVPRFVLALIVVAIFGAGLAKVIAVIAILSWPQTSRVVRSGYLSLREAPFVQAARVAGMGPWSIIAAEVLPNVLAPVVVIGTLEMASSILIQAGLSFFGLGDPNLVSWGDMLNESQQYLAVAWWMSLFPGLATALLVLALNVVGDGLNDALNPRLAGAR
jgi:peptide/nickel transport system permease protein